MKVNTIRLVSEKAACQILHITPERLEKLCSEGMLKKHKTSSSLYQYDFANVIECRKLVLEAVKSDQALKPPAVAVAVAVAEKPIPAPLPVTPVKVPQTHVFANDDFQKIARDLIVEKKLKKEFKSEKYRSVDPSTYRYFIKTALYYKSGNSENYSLYKSAGELIPEDNLDSCNFPNLYILNSDWGEAYHELRRGFIDQIKSHISSNEFEKAKTNTVNLLDFILFEHDEMAIQGLEEIVEVLFVESSRRKEMVLNLVPLLEQNISLGLHSARIMALALKFCLKNNYSLKDSKLLCISALLHDIGKTMLPTELITASPFNLTSDEDIHAFELHPQIGYSLLEDCGIRDKIIDYGALEHHERIDGSGFPYGKRKISFLGQVIGILDAYDALRSGQNPTGSVHDSMAALKVMKRECEEGKFSKELFQSFVYSLL